MKNKHFIKAKTKKIKQRKLKKNQKKRKKRKKKKRKNKIIRKQKNYESSKTTLRNQ